MFEKSENMPITKNELIKNKIITGNNNNYNLFYQSLYKNDSNFWNDFNKYLNYQMDSKIKNKETLFKVEDFASKIGKLTSGSIVNYNKFYSRINPVLCY